MNIKQEIVDSLKNIKWVVPRNVDEKKWYEACDEAIEYIEQLKEPNKAKMSLKELERSNILVQCIKVLETLSKIDIEYLNVKYKNGMYDSILMKDELNEGTQKAFEYYADELKAELKDLGFYYE